MNHAVKILDLCNLHMQFYIPSKYQYDTMYLNLGGGGGPILDLIEYGPLTFLHTILYLKTLLKSNKSTDILQRLSIPSVVVVDQRTERPNAVSSFSLSKKIKISHNRSLSERLLITYRISSCTIPYNTSHQNNLWINK